ncbi:hypothetical protein EV421DRAFT_490531 [Armillaria borealis]|uniref:Uncharacterized protein n=1 Tax=Armillaria borealis TaxID=47425 RepID=A0AA39MR85_9AGAR|nr:hypothetical protein EV421DRAFT_490531 [Armillaria borealis]
MLSDSISLLDMNLLLSLLLQPRTAKGIREPSGLWCSLYGQCIHSREPPSPYPWWVLLRRVIVEALTLLLMLRLIKISWLNAHFYS